MMTTILRRRKLLRNVEKLTYRLFIRLRYLCIENLCIEIYKTINNIDPRFMKQIFQLRETNGGVRDQYEQNLNVPKVSQVSYG